MDTRRAREELGWSPRYDAGEALGALLEGLRKSSGLPTPPLEPHAGGRLRHREFPPGTARSAT
jgi:hypothetical protein